MSTKTSPTTYLLRDVPADLWERTKRRAALDRLPLRSVLLLLADSYAAGTITIGGVRQHLSDQPTDPPAPRRRRKR